MPDYKVFNSPGGAFVNGAAYLLDETSGCFRPAKTTDFAANIQMTGGITASINAINLTGVNGVTVTGFYTGITIPVSLDSSALVLAQASGNALALTANMLLSGVSGQLSTNLAGAAWVTGSLIDQMTGWNTGITVSTQPVTKTSTSNLAPSGATPWTSMSAYVTGQILAANSSRVMFFIQNIHTGIPLYVALSSNAANTGNFSFILNPSATPGYGGSSFADDHYRGPICVSGGAWNAWEM